VRKSLYFELKPVIVLLASGMPSSQEHRLLPHTAHYLLQALNALLSYDPSTVIRLVAALCRAGASLNYHFEGMAITEIVRFAQKVLADHKDVLKQTDAALYMGEVLDIFVRAGWPDALQLTFKLDEAVR
jgi:hypothetical protein